ncbi:MAG TPA: alpha/beta fold hydrolase [Bacteroidota bacterium]|nr:alpha/beta fold hydrolase [Bacteroidota bacterium]
MDEDAPTRTDFHIPNTSGKLIHGEVRFYPLAVHKPVIVICHSFMAFKEWGFFPYIGERFAKAGFVAVTFNFSHNGVIGSGNRITDFEAFSENTISQEIDDLGAVIDALCDQRLSVQLPEPARLILLGHSRGGGVAIVRTSLDRRVYGLVTWSAIARFDRWTEHQKARWRRDGFLPLARDTAASPLRLGISLLRDIEERGEELSILRAASRVSVPWLLVHGRADVTVPPKEAEELFAASDKSISSAKLFEGVGHLYNASSRNEDQYHTLNQLLEFTTDWIHHTF